MKIVLTDPVFGKNLRYLRKQYCLSRRGLGKLIGVSEYKIIHLEAASWPVAGILLDSQAFFRIGTVFDVDANRMLAEEIIQ